MVGLPATGKTHIAKRICRFLNFFHDIPSQIFNVGDYRRDLYGAQQPAEFYDPQNVEGVRARTMACDAALQDVFQYIKQPGVRVAVFDATNSTKERRQHVVKAIKNLSLNAKHMFVESICDDEELLEENIRTVKLSTPDYRDMDPETAVADFKRRRENYLSVYNPVESSEGPSIKIINSKSFVINEIRGYLPLKVVHYCMNLHTLPRTFYLTRHGQSEYNVLGKIGGDSGLTPNGIEYAKRLADFASDFIAKETITINNNNNSNDDGSNDNKKDKEQNDNDNNNNKQKQQQTKQIPRPARLWTSTLRRTKETAKYIQHDVIQHTFDNGETGEWTQFRQTERRNLDEIYAGSCDGMTYKEIEQFYPLEFQRRQQDKLTYRYPRGESYMDVMLRLEPLAMDMERTREAVLIIGHQGILRILYAYFMGLDRKEAPYVSIPLNNVIELTPHAYGCHERRYCLMLKEEMLQDGQDEPVTSMPVMDKETITTNAPLAGNDNNNNNNNKNNTTNTNSILNDGTDCNKNKKNQSPPRRNLHRREVSLVLDNEAIDGDKFAEVEPSAQYDSNDPVMNAPSH